MAKTTVRIKLCDNMESAFHVDDQSEYTLQRIVDFCLSELQDRDLIKQGEGDDYGKPDTTSTDN